MAISESLVNRLSELLLLGRDNIEAYQQGVERMASEACREKFRQLQNDYRRQEISIRNLMQTYKVPVPEPAQSRGITTRGLTNVAHSGGDEAVLRSLLTNERLTLGKCQVALDDKSLPEETRRVIDDMCSDAARHLSWLSGAIDGHLWESGEEHASDSDVSNEGHAQGGIHAAE